MRAKKGVTQADWVLSIGIFLIYLAWFFVVIQPVVGPQQKETLPADKLKDIFNKNASWEVNVTPIILKSNQSQDNQPVIMDFTFPGDADSYAIKGKYWQIRDGRLFLTASFPSPSIMFEMVHSDSTYTKPSFAGSMDISERTAKSAEMQANFRKSMLDTVRYNDALRVEGFSMEVDGEEINKERNSFYSNSMFAEYKVITPGLNNTFYVFDSSPRVYCYVDASDNRGIDVDIRLHDYGEYYVNSAEHGSIKYNVSECDSFKTDYINFIESGHGLALIFEEPVSLRMCHDKGLVLNISHEVSGTFSYRIDFHDKNAEKEDLKSLYTAAFGATTVMEGLSGSRMIDLEGLNYTFLKSDWGMENDFNITVSTASDTLMEIGASPPRTADVHSLQYYDWMIDEYANQTRASVNLLMW